jgi:ATP-dependent DNA helicase RecG
MIEGFESEAVEFKGATIPLMILEKYFSALSNEAKIRGFQETWLIFGVSDDKKFVGIEF